MTYLVLNLSNGTLNLTNAQSINSVPFIQSYLNIRIPYSVILTIAVIVGVVGKF